MLKTHIMSCGCTDLQNSPMEKAKESTGSYLYCVQLGTFRTYQKAMEFQLEFFRTVGISDIEKQGELFSVFTGGFPEVDDAVILERYLKFMGYNTLLVAMEQKDNA